MKKECEWFQIGKINDAKERMKTKYKSHCFQAELKK